MKVNVKQPNPKYNREVASRLTIAREWKGLNKSEFARGAGIDESYWTIFEAGKKRISLECARAIKNTYGIPLDWIYDGDVTDDLPAGLLQIILQRQKRKSKDGDGRGRLIV